MKGKRWLSLAVMVCFLMGMIPFQAIYAADEEHVHTAECYELVCSMTEGLGHSHSGECYEEALVCPQEEHMHSESCYDENGELTCQLEEHEHGEECYEQNLICDLAEQAGHEHTDACYELICGYENTDTPTAPAEEKDNAAEKLAPGDESEDEIIALPDEEAPLTDILGVDADGESMMYTTLYDNKGRIISTNDPNYTQNSFYANGGTVKRGDAIDVRFRIAKIIPNDEGGVREDITYYMGALPSELIPEETDEAGNLLLNPAVPIEFIQSGASDDTLRAWGGIYGAAQNWQVKMFFRGVENRINISGSFQYGAIVSEALVPGESYTFDYVPGGRVGFTVAPETPDIGDSEYSASLSGGSGGPTAYYWQVGFGQKGAGKAGDIFPYKKMHLASHDAAGVWVGADNFGIFDAYGDKTGPGFSLGVTYTTKYTAADGSEKNKSEWLQATAKDIVKAENDSIVDEDGNITVRFKSADEPLQVDVVFKYADHIPGSDGAGGKYYITDDIYADFSDGNGNRAQNIQYVNFYIPIITYDDYAQTGNQSYEGAVYLYDTDEAADDIKATGYLNVNYNGLGTPSISSGNNGSTYDSYNFTMPKVYSYLYSNSSNYRGNYYWMEFAPNIENSYNALYYISNKSFLQGRGDNQLKTTGVNGKQATFTSDNANTCLRGMVGSDDWDYIGTVSVAQVQGDDNLVSNSCFAKSGGTNNGSATDAKLQYQLKQVFKNYSSDGQLVVYRSQSKHSYGEYMYLIIDPATVKTAQTCYNNGWNEYIDTTDGKAKETGQMEDTRL